MTTPAFAVEIVTVTRLGERSMSTLLMAAREPSLFWIKRRTARSLAKYLAYSCLPTNHLLRQSLLTWRRILIGLTFWPITFSPLRLAFWPGGLRHRLPRGCAMCGAGMAGHVRVTRDDSA